MSSMTLTEFLLARIAEDERHARKLAESDRMPVLSLAVTVNHPARLLVECEAKRRIVDMGSFSDSAESAVDFWLADGKCRTPPQPLGTMIAVFRALAMPYADHPDYDESWRP